MKTLFVVLGTGMALTACSDAVAPPRAATTITALPRPLTASERTLVTATGGFAFNLLRAETTRQPDSNVFLSPLSASAALGLTANGAAGTTLAAMQTVLGLEGQSMASMDTAYQTLFALLTTLDPNVDITVANAVWYDPRLSILPGFATRSQTFFNAPVTALDFSSPAAVGTINTWVDHSTGGKIPTLLASIPPTWRVFLSDAVYFSAPWRQAFDASNTHTATFYLASGATAPITLMDGHDSVAVAATAAYAAVDLPYGGGAFRMTIVLPATGVSVDAVTADLASGGWSSLIASLQPTVMEVKIPKIQLAWQDHLNTALTSMGMGVAFTDLADFSQLTTTPVEISDVVQKTYVSVDEHGTTAAAATGVGISPTVVQVPFVVDRPYVFAIRERLSGTVLFTGRIVMPPAA
jgi:serine protease inhibitor